MSLNDRVREYWQRGPCGTDSTITGDATPLTPEWFARVEAYRYRMEPFIHSVAQFTRHRGQGVLEVGVGAGTDHLQWARAGAICHGVDATDAAVETTRAHLALHGLQSDLRRVNAEQLPFEDGAFDVVYSWGVIHHSERPDKVIQEIHRVLKPGGVFLGMLYGRHSLVAAKLWVRHGLLRGRFWRSLSNVVWHHMESEGTKAYTVSEVRRLLGAFAPVEVSPLLTPYDKKYCPTWLISWLPSRWGWFLAFEARK